MKQSVLSILSSNHYLTYYNLFISVNPTTIWCNFSNKIKDSYNFSYLSVTVKLVNILEKHAIEMWISSI